MTTNTQTQPTTTEVATTTIAKLDANAKLDVVIAKVNELIDRMNAKRDRGPASTREMTEADARRVIVGDLKDKKHGEAAETLGLSYGQIYSARKGFTFKAIAKLAEKK